MRRSGLDSVITTGFTLLVVRSTLETETAMDDSSLAGQVGRKSVTVFSVGLGLF